jgi:hypothetical protein
MEDTKRNLFPPRTTPTPTTTAQQRTKLSFETSAPRQKKIILIGFLLHSTAQQAAFFWMNIL